VVADGKVFLYVDWRHPIGDGTNYHYITAAVLKDAGWRPDIPEALAKKLEAAWASPNRPNSTAWKWWEIDSTHDNKAKELDEFLARTPELDKYIKDFMAALSADEVAKYGDHIKRRLCMDGQKDRMKWGIAQAFAWEQLEKMSKLQDRAFPTFHEWDAELGRLGFGGWWNPCWRAFTRSDDMICVDAATGKTVWKKSFAYDNDELKKFPMIHNGYGCEGTCSTPAVWKGKAYFSGTMALYCLSAKDGSLVWKVKTNPEHASPVVAGGIVYHCGHAYDAETGKLLWKNPAWREAYHDGEMVKYGSPVLWTVGGVNYVITTDSGANFCCLELATGKVHWTLKRAPVGFDNVCIRGDLMLANSQLFRITPDGAQPLVDFKTGWCVSLFCKDYLYSVVANGESICSFVCSDLRNGEKMWSARQPMGDGPFSLPILADGKIFTPYGGAHGVCSRDGYRGGWPMEMVRPDPFEKYARQGTFNPGLCPLASIAIADGKLYARLEYALACYDLREHGAYLDGFTVSKDSLTFRLKQTGGGLVAKNPADVIITDAAGVAKPAKVRIDGDNIVVDTTGIALPFDVVCASSNAFAGKDGRPVPAFARKAVRLQIDKCFDNTIQLSSSPRLDREVWSNAVTFQVAGATIKSKERCGADFRLTTDKAWKANEPVSVTATYSCFPDEPGTPALAKVTLAAIALHAPAAKFVKTDATTVGNWKGVYGTQGAMFAGEATVAFQGVTVTSDRQPDELQKLTGWQERIWSTTTTEPRALQKTAPDAKDRLAAGWIGGQFDFVIRATDGKEHQVAFYCLDWDNFNGGRAMKVEVRDPDTGAVLDTQEIKEFKDGKHLVWNVQGEVAVHFITTGPGNWHDPANGAVSAVFVDPSVSTSK
jgi:hypothetical protein